MLAAVIASHAIAPPVVGAITSIVSTLVGSFFVNMKNEKTEDAAKPEDKPAPVAPVLPFTKKDDGEGGAP